MSYLHSFFKKGKIFICLLLVVLICASTYAQSSTCMSRTYTIGGWGTNATNPWQSQYLDGHFSSAFPTGLWVGCASGNSLTLNSAQAVKDFLPDTGTSGVLTTSYSYPGSSTTPSNTLVSQLVAVTLAVTFDAADPSFSSSSVSIGNYFIMDPASPFYGMTVSQFLALANDFIGGCATSSYTAAQFNQAATQINESFDNGTSNTGYLKCCKLTIHVNYEPIKCNGGMTNVVVTQTNGSSSTTGVGTFPMSAGSYTFSIQDGDCVDSKTITIAEPSKVAISASISQNIACNGGSGKINLVATGGASGIYDLYFDGVMVADNDSDGMFEVANVYAGNHSYYAIDANGCISLSGEISITQPEPLGISAAASEILCKGGSSTITFNMTGGTMPYALSLTTPSGIVNFNGINANTYTYSNATAGNYTFSITDANGCMASGTAVLINEPELLEIQATQAQQIMCHGEKTSVLIVVKGGTAPYDIYWNGVQVSTADVDGIFEMQNVSGSTTYNYSVQDKNGCNESGSVLVNEPTKLMAQANAGVIACYQGTTSVTFNIQGGTASYSIYENGGLVASGLSAGNYILTNVSTGVHNYSVKDQNDCEVALPAITILEPSPIVIKIPTVFVLCIGSTATVVAEVSGGTPQYTITWWNNGVQVGNGSTVNLPVGNYTVIVSDTNGCSKEASVEVKMLTCNGFTTVTQGGWGAPAKGKNWGSYRNQNFAGTFPSGLTIGAGSRFLKLSSASAVENFLPSGSTPRMLELGTMINPGSTYSNVLAGQVVALTLSVEFDKSNPNFSTSATNLEDLIVISGPFANWTVGQVLAEANNVLGGLPSTFTPQQLNDIVDAINNNYDNGTQNQGVLACPCPSTLKISTPALTRVAAPAENAIDGIEAVVFPNPTRGVINLKFKSTSDENFSVLLFNNSGKLVADLSRNIAREGQNVQVHYENYEMMEGVYILTVKSNSFKKSFKILVKK